MNSYTIRNEGWLYWLAFVIAVGFRMIQLGASPLTDSEATLALQALHIARGQSPLLGPQLSYTLLTSILFAVINTTNFMARFIPALVGSAFVFAPYFFREKLKPRPALILAFLFAIDPGLVALSRQANGTMLAVAFLFFAWAMWRQRRAVPAGVFAGLALLSGPSLWAGLLALGLTWLFLQSTETKPTSEERTEQDPHGSSNFVDPLTNYQIPSFELRPAIFALILTVLLGGTLFFLSPNGLSAWLSSLPAYLRGWTSAAIMTPGRMLLALVAYEPLGILLAVFSLIRGYRMKSRRIVRLSVWLAVALLLAVFYRQASELVWVIIPLLTLGALELSRAFHIFEDERVEVGLVVVGLMILLVYMWFGVSKIGLDPHGQLSSTVVPLFGRNLELAGAPYVVMLSVLIIIILSVAFVAYAWSARTAWLGTIWAAVIFLGVYTLASAWGASRLRADNGVELWTADQPPMQVELLLSTVDDVSEFSLGHTQSQPVTVMGIDSPALEWVLRDRPVEVVSSLDPQIAPPLVVTPLMDDLGLPSAYRGQDFTWRQTPQWRTITNPDWVRWLVFRQLPKENESIILWARNDLFPDARETSQQP